MAIELLILAVALAMDAFAVAICKGLSMAIDTIHSLNELPKTRHKLLKGLFLNANNLHNYFIFTLNIRFSIAK